MRNKESFQGCMLGLAIGDCLGYPTEFIRTREDINVVTGGGVKDLPAPPIYTDDTQMTLCIAEALAETAPKGDDVGPFMKSLSAKFIDWYDKQHGEYKRAPGNTCLGACERLKWGMSWEKSGIETSLGCGSAMRSAPIGLYFQRVEQVVDFALNSSLITHSHELAMSASVGTALITHLAMNDVSTGQWANELVRVASINKEFTDLMGMAAEAAAEAADPDFVLSNECLGEGWTGHEAVASALFCCMVHPNSYKDAVLLAANTVGDSDSIACITGAWMGAKLGIGAIPKDWAEKIEDSERLFGLANKLFDLTVDQN